MFDEHRVVASTRLIAGLTLLSRVLGLARECIYGAYFGTGPLLSAFRIAFMVPNLARRLFGEGALSAAFIPIFTRALKDPDENHARRLAGGVLTLLVSILVAIVIVAEGALLLAHAMHPSLTLKLTITMLPFLAMICVAAFLGGTLNALHRFAAPAATPIILNVFIIAAISAGAYGAGWSGSALIQLTCVAVLAAGICQMALLLLSLRRTGFRIAINRDWSHPDISEIKKFMIPMMVGLSTVQLNTLLDMLIALFLIPDGRGPAVLGYAHFLYQLPLGVFGIAIATATFPVMAARAADDDTTGLTRTLEQAARLSFFVALPASVGIILIAQPLVVSLFQRGLFDAGGAERVSRALIFYALGLCAYSMQHILVRAFYSLKDAKTPVRIAAFVVGINLILNLALVGPLREAGVALATAVSAAIQVCLLIRALRHRLTPIESRTLRSCAIKTSLSTAAMGGCVWLIVGEASPLGTSHWPAFAQVVVSVTLGCGVFVVAARLLGASELTDLLHRSRAGQAHR